MIKKFFASITLLFILINNFFLNYITFGSNDLLPTSLYYSDTDDNGKIDTLELEFSEIITGSLNYDKIFLYSNTGGLSTLKLDSVYGNGIFQSYYLSGNILGIKLIEQDNYLTGLTINNTTSSQLRLKTNSGAGIFNSEGNQINISLTSSFNNYHNVYFRNTQINNGNNNETGTGTQNSGTGIITQETNSGSGIINTGSGEVNTGSGNTNSGTLQENTNSGTVNTFSGSIKFLFQNPTYLTGIEIEKDIYECDRAKTDCRVNFNTEANFGSGFATISTTKYDCLWDFGFAEETQEETKCNPNTITYPVGNFTTTLKITQKSNTGSTISKTLNIKNEGFAEELVPIKTVYVGGGGGGTTIVQYMYIDTPKIIIQGGLDENNNCKTDDCNLNLSYEVKNSKEACLWSFPGGSFDLGTDKKCNPGYVKYPKGNFKATLRVYEAGNESNYKESFIDFKNISTNTQIKIDETKQIKTNGNTPTAKITLQGTLTKDKKISGQYLTCQGEECSVNLTGEDSYHLDKTDFSYFWDLGNGQTFTGSNPPAITYKLGEYKIKLKLTDKYGLTDEENFYVSVVDNFEDNKIKESENTIIQENISNYPLKISQVLPNPTGADDAEWIEIKNVGNTRISLSGCVIDDKIKSSSSPYDIKSDLYLDPLKTKKFYKFDTEISLNNTPNEEVNLLCNGSLVDKMTWWFAAPENFIITPDILAINSNEVFIERVVDGDTYVIVFPNGKKEIIRHIGIDTPETKHPKKEIQVYGLQASEFAKKSLEGKKAYFIMEKSNFVDVYGRLLGYISLDNKKTFGEEILEVGLAKVYDNFEFGLLEKFKKSENIAKQNKVGLWSLTEINIEKLNLEDKKSDISKIELLPDDLKKDVLAEIIKENIISETTSSGDTILETPKIDTKKVEEIINNSFNQKISKQKKGIKIYGTALPNVTLVFTLDKIKETSFLNLFFQKAIASSNSVYETQTDEKGKYEVLVTDPIIGEFQVKTVIKASSGEIFSVAKTSNFDVDNDYLEYVGFDKKLSENTQNIELKPKAIITLNGKDTKSKKSQKNKVICAGVDECSINFDGRESIGNNLKYSWDFGNGQIFTNSNPTSIKFKTGNYLVSLTVKNEFLEDTTYFAVQVLGKPSKVEKNEVKKELKSLSSENTKNLSISSKVDKNPVSVDSKLFVKQIIYSILLFGLFLVLSFAILRKREII